MVNYLIKVLHHIFLCAEEKILFIQLELFSIFWPEWWLSQGKCQAYNLKLHD